MQIVIEEKIMFKKMKEWFRIRQKNLNHLLTAVNRVKVYQNFSPYVKSKSSFIRVGGFLC